MKKQNIIVGGILTAVGAGLMLTAGKMWIEDRRLVKQTKENRDFIEAMFKLAKKASE